MAKISRFLDVVLNEEEIDRVTERCSIEHMKKVNKFDYLMPLNTDKGLWNVDKDTIVKSGELVNTGGVGTGKPHFRKRVQSNLLSMTLYSYFLLYKQGARDLVIKWLHSGRRPRKMNSDTILPC